MAVTRMIINVARPKTSHSICEHCSETFSYDPTRNPDRQHRFCSISCSSQFAQARARDQALASPPKDKICSKCGDPKPLADYATNPNTGKPWHSYCLACGPTVAHGHYAIRTKEQRDAYNKKRKETREHLRANQPVIVRAEYKRGNLKKYGISLEEFEILLDKQQGMCAICGRPWGAGRNDGVDHDHKTGVVRGLLCTMCNAGLGHFSDDVELMRKAISYLEVSRIPTYKDTGYREVVIG